MRLALESNQTPFALLRPLSGIPVLVRVLPAGEKQMLVPASAEDLRKHSHISITTKEELENASECCYAKYFDFYLLLNSFGLIFSLILCSCDFYIIELYFPWSNNVSPVCRKRTNLSFTVLAVGLIYFCFSLYNFRFPCIFYFLSLCNLFSSISPLIFRSNTNSVGSI